MLPDGGRMGGPAPRDLAIIYIHSFTRVGARCWRPTAMASCASAPSSSFFPNAERSRHSRFASPPFASRSSAAAAPAVSAPAVPPWVGLRYVAPEDGEAVATASRLCPPLSPALWDRTPHGAPLALRPPTPRLALPAALLHTLAEQALSSRRGAAESAWLLLDPDEDNGSPLRGWTASCDAACRRLKPVDLRAVRLQSEGGGGSGGGGGGGGGGGEPGRRAAAPLLARGWPSDGATLGGTVADYAEMLDALDDALDVSSPLRADTPVYAGVRASPTA